ncbi:MULTISPECIES: hypothetical protein [unclassified Streptomyces]|uniref:hypothetical protein n=1 Tax=unclassified Streptomyces TaxID=2593676 RepID=UPI00109BF5E9|nr:MULTISPECIES: hypothetical protein [unclassified Streptomyces]MCE3033783.1 hypothetical protein [Streptomyces sp. CMSTAAHL-2]MYR01564.1 hypothetical protein [Streptomyces sp. SID6139]MYR22096.1 hypothetical protein [Streptomyces sp. SID6137]TGZ15997.1 hypothetical protein DV517_09700 [Streptomyces sp. S816]
MSWDEWEQLKADAASRGGTGMRLNQTLPAGTGGDTADGLKSDKKVWTKAGEDTKGLQDGLGKALGRLADGQSGLGDPAGCRSAAAQKELYDSWKKYVGDVNGRCGDLGGLLERAGRDLAMTDGEVKAALDKIKAKYVDTEAVGGQAQDR